MATKKNKFKKGDLVHIFQKVEPEGWHAGWCDEMDKYVGHIGKVLKSGPLGDGVKIQGAHFPKDWLDEGEDPVEFWFPHAAIELADQEE